MDIEIASKQDTRFRDLEPGQVFHLKGRSDYFIVARIPGPKNAGVNLGTGDIDFFEANTEVVVVDAKVVILK